jgi:cell division protein FtsN
MSSEMTNMTQQRGGTLVGFIIGLVVGLAVALGVAVYVTKVPIPFMNKVQNRNADQDAAEEKKNKDWDPNAPLYGKNPAKPLDKGEATDAKPDMPAPVPTPASNSPKPDAAAKVDPKSSDPLGDLAKAKVADPKPVEAKTSESKTTEFKPAVVGGDPFIYFVQAGAFRTNDEAETQRAKLGLLGLDAKVSERDQGGRTVYRVRVGPLETKADAERVRVKLETAHLDSAMVRVQR